MVNASILPSEWGPDNLAIMETMLFGAQTEDRISILTLLLPLWLYLVKSVELNNSYFKFLKCYISVDSTH